MRAVFEDVLAMMFVFGLITISFVFLTSGSLINTSAMSEALNHRIMIEKLRSGSLVFQELNEPLSNQNLVSLVEKCVCDSKTSLMLSGGVVVDVKKNTEQVLSRFYPNYYFIVEPPEKHVFPIFILSSNNAIEPIKSDLLQTLPRIINYYADRGVFVSPKIYFLESDYVTVDDWCNDFRTLFNDFNICDVLTPNMNIDDFYFNEFNLRGLSLECPSCSSPSWGDGIGIISFIGLGNGWSSSSGTKILFPIVNSLSGGDFPVKCLSLQEDSTCCSICNVTESDCPIQRSSASIERGIFAAIDNNVKVCPLSSSFCFSGSSYEYFYFEEACFISRGWTSLSSECGASCNSCEVSNNLYCFGSACSSELDLELEELASRTSCASKRFKAEPGELEDFIISNIDSSLLSTGFYAGFKPPKDVITYTETIEIPIVHCAADFPGSTSFNGKLTIW